MYQQGDINLKKWRDLVSSLSRNFILNIEKRVFWHGKNTNLQ